MPSRWTGCLASALCLLVIAAETGCGTAPSATNGSAGDVLIWKGHTWSVTAGGMAGVAKGDPANVFVDQNGYLHLRIINRRGSYTASELFSTDKIGFGTYQWQVEGHVDNMDKSTVLGFFPYGPKVGIGVDAENEIFEMEQHVSRVQRGFHFLSGYWKQAPESQGRQLHY